MAHVGQQRGLGALVNDRGDPGRLRPSAGTACNDP
jgi:hypothetical protein